VAKRKRKIKIKIEWVIFWTMLAIIVGGFLITIAG